MAKKKWVFNAFIMNKNLEDSSKIHDMDIDLDMRLCADADVFIYNPEVEYYDTTECFIEALKGNKHEAVELSGLLSEHIADIVPYLKGVKYLSLFKCNRVDDLSFIEKLTDLREVYIYWNQKATKVFDAKKLPHLTQLSIEDANKLTDFSGLEGSNIEKLRIWGCNFLGSFTSKTVIEDFEIFTKMPKLRSLNLVPVKNTNSQKDLLALSKLSKLENLHLPEGYFTFEQFAWLSSKLANVKGLEPVWEYESLQDELMWSVIGKKQPRALKKRESRDEYEAKFYVLVEKYNKRENPPMDEEKD